ncbi:hypothetical protein L6452_14757 [Arctium lappa]|uniref:Uncharacterized protein n=1 Tax=Arctium lappa TaxID=4217 RepID=A0ACB9CLV5_ARCLA|nr:hypothetical protein L6452_14757 [Arctium lappa]
MSLKSVCLKGSVLRALNQRCEEIENLEIAPLFRRLGHIVGNDCDFGQLFLKLQNARILALSPLLATVSSYGSLCLMVRFLVLHRNVALKKLCIKGCPVSDEGIETFAWVCPNLVKIKGVISEEERFLVFERRPCSRNPNRHTLFINCGGSIDVDEVMVNGITLEIHLYWAGKGTTAIPDRVGVNLNNLSIVGVETDLGKFLE